MVYSFTCYGHGNITAKHKTTLEFTKDGNVSLKGDCIVGVKGDFLLKDLKKFIKSKKSRYNEQQLKNKIMKKLNNEKIIKNNKIKIPIKIKIRINNIEEEINGFLNTDFNDSKEIVIRKSDFASERTLVVGADKSAVELNKKVIGMLRTPYTKALVILR